MSSGYVGEIRMFCGNFAPAGWALCQGQLMPISEYETLFNLIGTTYGGDGQETFGLPNLVGRAPIHMGGNGTTTYNLADSGGVTTVTLTTNQIPVHNHTFIADTKAGTTSSPTGACFAASSEEQYTAGATTNPLAAVLQVQGGNQPHDNMQPYLAINFIISLSGIYPSQT